MTRHDVPAGVLRWGAILGLLISAWALLTAATRVLDARYATLAAVQQVEIKVQRALDLLCEGREEKRACKQ